MEQLKDVFGEECVIEGNVLKLTNNVTIEENKSFNINIPSEVIIELNGKTLQFVENALISIGSSSTDTGNKTTIRDSLGTGCIKFTGETLKGFGIMVNPYGNLTIQNVNVTNNNRLTLVETKGKLTINNSNFSTNCNDEQLKEEIKLGKMFNLGEASKTEINGGNFNSITEIISASSIINNCQLNINEGNYEVTDGYPAIDIMVYYPYIDENNEKQLIVPKIVLNNCNVSHSFGSAVSLHTTYDEEVTEDTKIITILGGNYKGYTSALDIVAQGKYLNTNDIVIKNGKFENTSTSDTYQGAITIGLTKDSQFEYNGELKKILNGYNGKIYYADINGSFETMRTIEMKDYKVVSATGELNSKLHKVIDPGVVENSKTITDNKTNIKLETQKDVIPENATMEITEITSGETFNKIKDALAEIEKFKAFDITLKSDGINIKPNGKVKISIPIPEEFDKSKLVVYRFEEDESKTEYQVQVNNSYATFETDHFSTYILGEKEITDGNKNNGELPQTGEEDNPLFTCIYITIAISVLIIASMLVVDYNRKKKESKKIN